MSSPATPAQSARLSNIAAWISVSGSLASAATSGGTTKFTRFAKYVWSVVLPFSAAALPALKMSGSDATAALRTSSWK